MIPRARIILATSRPRFWLYLAGPVLVGAVYGASSLEDVTSTAVIVLLFYFLLPGNLLLYGVNDAFDAEIDRQNPKKDERERRWQGDPTVASAVLISGLAGIVTFGVTPPIAWGYLLGFFALAIAYSVPPLRFKTTPILDSLSNGLYILPGAAMYAALAGTHPPLLALAGAWLWTMGMHTVSAIPDIIPDREAGIETTATRLGAPRTFVYCGTCWGLAAVAFGMIDLRAGLLISIYPVVLASIAFRPLRIERAYWWFPGLNTAVGALFTVVGLWRLSPVRGGLV